MKFIFKVVIILVLISPFGFTANNLHVSCGIATDIAWAIDGAGSGSGDSILLNNPLGDNVKDIPTFVQKLLEVVMKVGVPLVAVAIIYTGYLFISAQGNPEKLKKAKDAILYVFIGSMILLGAYVIAQALHGTISAIRGN